MSVRTKYDGSPVLQFGGCFLAGLATHRSAEPDTLVVRYQPDDREWLLEDAPDVYYVTDYYRKYPLVLVRLRRIDDDALRELLTMSRQLTAAKARRREWTDGTARLREPSDGPDLPRARTRRAQPRQRRA